MENKKQNTIQNQTTNPSEHDSDNTESYFSKQRKLGYMLGQFSIPLDFDEMGQSEIEQMFYSDDFPKS